MRHVIVAGAGPVGLWVAAELRLAGIPVTILEKEAERNPHSRALTVHPRSVELLAMRGLAGPFLDEGIPIPSGHFGLLDSRLDFTVLDTPFPFTLAIEQVRTEQLLEERVLRLGAELRRRHRVVGVRQDADGVEVEVEGPAGTYRETAGYVVGCEGTRSVVRDTGGIGFPGTDSTLFGALADVELSEPPPAPIISQHTEAGALLMVGLPGGHFRFVIVDPQLAGVGPEEPLTLDDFRARVARIAGADFPMHSPAWLSRFGNATRIAQRYRHGRLFVAGDAAHMHFPTGGVGLNVGLQDAMNLGWKLAAELQAWAPDGLLDSYDAERRPVGERLIESSLAQTALVDAFTPQGQALRSVLAGLVERIPDLARALAERLSALDVTYADDRDQLVGARAPDVRLEAGGGASLFELLRTGRFAFLDFDGQGAGEAVRAAFAGRVEVHRATVVDDRPAWRALSAVLIRPDGHVAWAAEVPRGTEDVIDAVARWAGAPTHDTTGVDR